MRRPVCVSPVPLGSQQRKQPSRMLSLLFVFFIRYQISFEEMRKVFDCLFYQIIIFFFRKVYFHFKKFNFFLILSLSIIIISLRKVQMNFWENIRGALLQIAIRYMVILIRASTRPAGLTADENLMTQCLLK